MSVGIASIHVFNIYICAVKFRCSEIRNRFTAVLNSFEDADSFRLRLFSFLYVTVCLKNARN